MINCSFAILKLSSKIKIQTNKLKNNNMHLVYVNHLMKVNRY